MSSFTFFSLDSVTCVLCSRCKVTRQWLYFERGCQTKRERWLGEIRWWHHVNLRGEGNNSQGDLLIKNSVCFKARVKERSGAKGEDGIHVGWTVVLTKECKVLIEPEMDMLKEEGSVKDVDGLHEQCLVCKERWTFQKNGREEKWLSWGNPLPMSLLYSWLVTDSLQGCDSYTCKRVKDTMLSVGPIFNSLFIQSN